MSEDSRQPSSADEVMDTTEAKDFSDGDHAIREELDEDDDGGLFGSGSEDERNGDKKRRLDDEELDSGDDEGRHDRMDEDMDGYGAEEIETQRSVSIAEVEIGRHPLPRGKDSEVWTQNTTLLP